MYQVAQFKNYKTNRYDLRRIYINQNNEIVKFDSLYITKEQFESNIERNVTAIINNSNISYGANGITTSDKQMSCDELFDSSIMEIINDILKYPRYIVPALILLLGTLDFLKAVMASKEDEMKKAQRTFIKRVIIGVAVFLVPVFMNAIIWLANLAWKGLGYTTCNF